LIYGQTKADESPNRTDASFLGSSSLDALETADLTPSLVGPNIPPEKSYGALARYAQ